MENWLKSLRLHTTTAYNPYKATVEAIAKMCEKYVSNIDDPEDWAEDFLNNVRVKCKEAKEYDAKYPQNHWKPTEEQMKVLEIVSSSDNEKESYIDAVLQSLYNDLKKLIEK